MKTNPLIFILTLAVLCLTPKSGNAQGNLIDNGSFENGFNGWAQVRDPFYLGDTNSLNGIPITIPDGNHFAFYQGSISPIYGVGALDTFISTTPGVYYLLTFSSIAFDGTNSASVNINGNLFASLNFASTVPVCEGSSDPSLYNTAWQNFSFIFQASSSFSDLDFQYTSQMLTIPDGAVYDYFYGAGGFDNFSVTAVPEPGTVALLGAGLAGWLACRRHTRIRSENQSSNGLVSVLWTTKV